ncbi:hypothetical protein EVAR_77474_1 [Eumeta japonica]|uniref:Uncharacterized protein n=1 Tax=Eumeta variegata TaxID=151549 RepID=A0A4C1T751_EUMVA|nr:hypothetical protein EVAR_77474_1 [Eumeta japonica]
MQSNRRALHDALENLFRTVPVTVQRMEFCPSELPTNDAMRRFNAPRPFLLLRRVPISRRCDAFVANFPAVEFRHHSRFAAIVATESQSLSLGAGLGVLLLQQKVPSSAWRPYRWPERAYEPLKSRGSQPLMDTRNSKGGTSASPAAQVRIGEDGRTEFVLRSRSVCKRHPQRLNNHCSGVVKNITMSASNAKTSEATKPTRGKKPPQSNYNHSLRVVKNESTRRSRTAFWPQLALAVYRAVNCQGPSSWVWNKRSRAGNALTQTDEAKDNRLVVDKLVYHEWTINGR